MFLHAPPFSSFLLPVAGLLFIDSCLPFSWSVKTDNSFLFPSSFTLSYCISLNLALGGSVSVYIDVSVVTFQVYCLILDFSEILSEVPPPPPPPNFWESQLDQVPFPVAPPSPVSPSFAFVFIRKSRGFAASRSLILSVESLRWSW